MTEIAVIFATDVVGYSKHMEKDEDATLSSLNACNKIIEPLIKKQKGRIFNTGGDSVFAIANYVSGKYHCYFTVNILSSHY